MRNPIKSVKNRIKYYRSEDRKYRDYWYSCAVDEHSILIEPGRGETVSGNMFALLKEVETNPKWAGYRPFFVITDKTRAEAELKIKYYGFDRVKLVKRMSDEYLKLLASCKYFFSDNTYPVLFCKKPDQVLANTWHGTPLKHMGKAVLEGARGLNNVQRNYFMADHSLFPNDFTRDVFMDDYLLRSNFSGDLVMLDYPRNDAFHDDEMRVRVRKEQDMEGKRAYAYMPTWRGGDSGSVNTDEQIAEVSAYLAKLDAMLGSEEILYVNLHPFVAGALSYESFSHIKTFPKEYETYDFLNACDALITDYSSVMFDYAETGRRVILFTYDLEDYLSSRGMYIDIRDLPFDICRSVEDVKKAFSATERPDYSSFIDVFCNLREQGRRCSEAFLDTVIGDRNGEPAGVRIEKPEREEKHLHLLGRRILRLV